MELAAQKIIDRILQDAREEAKFIVDEAKKSSEILLKNQRQSALQKAEKEISHLSQRAESETEIVRGKVILDTKRQASWMVLSKKEDLVTNILNLPSYSARRHIVTGPGLSWNSPVPKDFFKPTVSPKMLWDLNTTGHPLHTREGGAFPQCQARKTFSFSWCFMVQSMK